MISRGWLVSLSRHGMLECLACGHGNKPGDKFCAQCASSLDLKLCGSCEAMNANSDARCYKCGAELWAEPRAPVPVQDPSRPANRGTAVLFGVPIALVAGTVAFYFNGQTVPSNTGATSTIVAPAPEVRTASWGPVQSSHLAGDTAVSAKIMSVSVTQAMPAAVVMERAVSSVTHTRARPVATPVAVSSPEPSREKLAAPSYSRVTHTKAQEPARKPRSGAAAFAVAASLPGEESIDSREEQPDGCAAGVAALGLCLNK